MTPRPDGGEVEPLIALLSEQRDIYLRLRTLSEQQRGLISSDRPDTLLQVLHDRQAMVARLARLNEQLAPFQGRWESGLAQLAPDVRARATALLDEIKSLLGHILKTDQEDSALLSARKQAVARELSETAGGRTVHAAYGAQSKPPTAPRAADLTG